MRWYERGADAVARVRPDLPRCYICPTGEGSFPPEHAGKLSREHVPPQGLGLASRPLVLICGGCNSRFGSGPDVQMLRVQTLVRFPRGAMQRPERVRMVTGGLTVRTDLSTRDGTYEIVVLPRENDPAIQSRFETEVPELLAEGREFHIQIPGCSEVETTAGWLRVGYLVAFATFGYRYALSDELAPVRAHITDPSGSPLPTYYNAVPEAAESDRWVAAVVDPPDMRSIVVNVAHHRVFLPVPDDAEFYDRRASERQRLGRAARRLRAKAFHWPREPMHLLDFS